MNITKFSWLEGRANVSHQMRYLLVGSTTVGIACLTVYHVTKNTDYEYLTLWTGVILIVWITTYNGTMDTLARFVLKHLSLNRTTNEENTGKPTVHYDTATIANSLIPHLKSFMEGGRAAKPCTLVITGSDCHPMTEGDYPWRQFLCASLDKGHCHVIQYISDGNHGAVSILERLQAQYPTNFEYRRLANPDAVHDPADRELVEALRTFHPTLAWRGDGDENDDKLMWIESYHPPESTMAYGCDYYSPDTLRDRHDEFDFYREKLKHAWEVSQCSNTSSQAVTC